MKTRKDALLCGLLGLFLSAAPLFGQVITSDLELWFRADAGVTVDGSGTNVTNWADQSVNGNDARQTPLTPANQPDLVANAINGLPALHFDGASDFLIATNNTVDLTSGLSIFIIAKNNVRKTYNGLFKLGPSNTALTATADLELYWHNAPPGSGSGHLIYAANGSPGPLAFKQVNNAPPAAGNYYLYDVIVPNSSTVTQRINGVALAPTTSFGSQFLPLAASYAAIGVGYGGGSGDSASSLNGEIAEIVVYSAALTDAQRNQVAGTLADKYGLSIPEPGTAMLAMLGAIVLLWRRR